MKRNVFTLSIILLLMAGLAIPVFAASQEGRASHWSQKYIDALAAEYEIEPVFKDKNLNAFITAEDFRKIVSLVINDNYKGTPDSTLRESIVYEFTRLWAEKFGTGLDEIMTIQMLIYVDTDKIDAKYNHAITVAYMKDIARGRGQGIFDPKTNTTYGELATLAYFTDKAIKTELETEAVERLETRVSHKLKENSVLFDFELLSHYSKPRKLTFSSGQQFEVTITNADGEEVYRYSDGMDFTMALVFRTINPGESFNWQVEWDMTDKNGVKLTSGNYKAEVHVLALYAPDGERVDDKELTATVEFTIE